MLDLAGGNADMLGCRVISLQHSMSGRAKMGHLPAAGTVIIVVFSVLLLLQQSLHRTCGILSSTVVLAHVQPLPWAHHSDFPT